MSSQGPAAAAGIIGIQGDASNWTQILKRRKTFMGLVGISYTGVIVQPDLLQSSQLQIDYRLGATLCGAGASYPRLRTGQGC